MSLEQDLKQIGLEEKEAKVYLAALELGPTSIQNLTKKSGIKRSTVYEMLKSLSEKGLVSESIRGKRPIIVAAGPENLKKNIKTKEQLLNEILPELKSISNIGFTKPKIMFFEGKAGLQEIYQDTLKTKGGIIYWVSPTKSITETVGENFLGKYVENRTKRKIRAKLIHITSNMVYYRYLDPKSYEPTLRDVRFTPDEINIPNAIAIYDTKVAIMSSRKEGFGFIIESEDYTKSMKVFYDLLWNISKPWGDMNFDNAGKSVENKSSTINKVLDKETEEKEDDYWSVK